MVTEMTCSGKRWKWAGHYVARRRSGEDSRNNVKRNVKLESCGCVCGVVGC